MPLFQKSVLSSIKQDESLIALRWAAYQNYLSKIDFIKTVKEEKYQDGFLKDIFENGLGYTLDSTNPSAFNLEREKKNETDGKKADGVIVINGEIIGIVELKDQKTKNLDAVEAQAFNYHNSHTNSKYIIISNFDELRFYIDKKTAYEKFSLFNLTYEEFKTLHLLLSYESIRDNVPLKLKEKSTNFEQTISKELYRDFSRFRTHLFENIVKNNYSHVIPDVIGEPSPENWIPNRVGNDEGLDKQTLLRLTQKLCDRIIFILFAEDRGLLRANTIKEIREHFKNQAFTTYTLYDIYKFYFQAINEGNGKLNIPKYNGGLFATDALLDSLIIDDEYLDMEAQKLSDFDFVSEISVNILGHIFEQSLTDLEEMNASINDTEFDKKKSKRKKDGVFYTPEYITRYIVENTLGKLCTEKKEELGLTHIEPPVIASNAKQSRLSAKEKETLAKLYEYRDYLLNLKILDPACGSGAFLNQALEFLIREHKNVDDYRRAYENEMLSLYDIEANILEHNLYGVDINEDAVEIARLSLWLRTAQSGRPLTNLSDKIKCGNSLIADKSVAGNAFVWEEEFPDVFAHGGFDVVIGNPPYLGGRDWKNKELEKYFILKYKVAEYQFDMYILFMELGINLVRTDGLLSYITPNTWLNNQKNTKLRAFVLKKTAILSLVDYSQIEVFSDATVLTTIVTLKKSQSNTDTFIFKPVNDRLLQSGSINQSIWLNNDYHIMNIDLSDTDNQLISKIELISSPLENIAKIKFGVKLYETGKGEPKQEAFFAKEKIYESDFQVDVTYQKYITGKDIERYGYIWENTWVKYGKNLAAPREAELFKGNKIVVRRIVGDTLIATSIQENLITSQLLQIVKLHDDGLTNTITAILNSKLMIYYFRKKYNRQEKTFPEIRIYELGSLPIPKNISVHVDVDLNASFIIDSIRKLKQIQMSFINELKLEKIPQKLKNFEALEFDEFVKEYAKAKKIKFADKLEERNFKNDWLALFENDKKSVLELKEQIAKTDKEIDAMVYALYGLNEDEIAIVEG